MKRALMFVILACCLTAPARTQGFFNLGVQVDYASINPPGAVKDIYSTGFGGGVHLDVHLIPMLRIRGMLDYLSFSPDNGKYQSALATLVGAGASDFSISGGRVGILAFAVNGKYSFPLPFVSPYLTAGIGTANVSVSDLTVTFKGAPVSNVGAVNSSTRALLDIGAGVDLDLLMVPLYVEVKYVWLSKQGDQTLSYVPVTLGVTF